MDTFGPASLGGRGLYDQFLCRRWFSLGQYRLFPVGFCCYDSDVGPRGSLWSWFSHYFDQCHADGGCSIMAASSVISLSGSPHEDGGCSIMAASSVISLSGSPHDIDFADPDPHLWFF